MKTLVLSLGRSVEGILADAIKEFGQPKKVLLLVLPSDQLVRDGQYPKGAELVTVYLDGTTDKEVELTQGDVCVLNGGTTTQQWAIARLSRLGSACKVVNLQRDDVHELIGLRNFGIVQIDRDKVSTRAKLALVDFVPGSGNDKLAKLILDAVDVKGATVFFFTGGDDSEPEGAVVKIPGMTGWIEVYEARALVDWSGIEPQYYQRWGDDPSFSSTPTYYLDETGKALAFQPEPEPEVETVEG